MSKLDRAQRDSIPATRYAYPKKRRTINRRRASAERAIARFNQVKDVEDTERDEAWKRIQSAAKKFDVEMTDETGRELSHHGKS
jgi:hypothetical protein